MMLVALLEGHWRPRGLKLRLVKLRVCEVLLHKHRGAKILQAEPWSHHNTRSCTG